MNIQILQENLLRAITRVGRIVSLRPQLPVLQNIKLTAKKDGLIVAATNIETSETAWVGGKIGKEGEACVSSRVFSELITSLPSETVRLVVEQGVLHVSCTGFTASLPSVPVAEFPPIAVVSEKEAVKVDKEKISAALSSVLFSAATDEGRPLLTGIKIQEDTNETVFAATDGYRLSVRRMPLAVKKLSGAVVPSRALSEVVKIALEEKDEKEILIGNAGDSQAGFVIGDTALYTRLLDGEYPNFDRIIPKTFTTRVLVEKESFTRAVRSAAIFARDNANIVRITLDKQKIVVSANAPQVGENKIEIESKIDGDGGEIAFNSRFLLEFLANFAGEEFLFEMTGALNPGLFRPVKDDSYLHIIMPVRVTS